MEDIIMTEKNLIPLLRFPKFVRDTEWICTTLRAEMDYENGVAHENDIDSLGKYIVVNSKFISTEGQIEKRSNNAHCLAEENDILMVLSDLPNGKAIAKCFYVDASNKYTVNQRICKLRSKGANSKLLYYLINRNPYFLSFDDGVKQTNLKKEEVLNCPLILPISLEEQDLIAECLSSIDSYISSIIQKVEQLKAHKKSFIQKLFPQGDKTVPEYRFPEFKKDCAWEKREFKEIIKVNSGRDYKHLSSGNIPVYGTGGYMLSVNGKLSDKDAVGIGRKGTIDRPQYLKAPFWTVDTLFFLTNCDGYDIEFIYYLSQIIQWKKYGEQTGVPSLSKNSIERLEVVVPTNIEEQKRIACALSSLDEEITLLEKKVSLLGSHKNGLMQQLFPQI